MKRLLLLVAIVLMATNMAQAQDSTIMARAYKDSLYKATVTNNKAERTARRLFEDSQPWKTKFIVGVNLVIETQIVEWNARTSIRPNFGASFEAQFTRHSGLETGLYYRSVVFPGGNRFDSSGNLVPYSKTNIQYLSLPILYKYYSRILNFAVGFTIDQEIDNSTGMDVDKTFVGLMFKITKDISLLDKKLILEPSLHFNPQTGTREGAFIAWSMAWMGGSLALKYRF